MARAATARWRGAQQARDDGERDHVVTRRRSARARSRRSGVSAPDDGHRGESGEHAGKASRARRRRASACRGGTRRAPTPEASDSTESPASSTDCCIHCAAMATPICTTPQNTVAIFDSAHQRRVVGVGTDVLQIEVVDRRRRHRVDRRRQRRGDDGRDDEAGGAVAQRVNHVDRAGSCRCDRAAPAAASADRRCRASRRSAGTARTARRRRSRSTTRPRCASLQRSRREQALHEVLIGAVGRERQREAAEQPGPEGVDLRRHRARSRRRGTCRRRGRPRSPRRSRRRSATSSEPNTSSAPAT